ncbi:hypothetical protein [Nocardia sp. NPDC050435]|uniref:hypothetical protein n=1 Tax=Nocardia sp. NPDC050435 TaxID=3155040 RepID=UPI0033F578CF
MRPTAAGTILDASALVALPRSLYARTLVDVSVREGRPLIIPAAALYTAALAGADPADFDAADWAITPVTATIVAGLVMITQTATAPVGLDIAQVAWEAEITGFPVLTDNPGPYAGLAAGLDLDVL